MSHEEIGELHLRRSDPAQNVRRFYTLAIQPNLFGGVAVVRHWGRIGTNGQEKIETYDEPQAAEAAYGRLERVKRRRGYKELEVEENR
ncbi:WGR domain-containing protein (plasmid) [Rhizobium sp. CB3171]|uniref:WGR domain-containing protein n=1 Tax=Rhizobium sp. CB3171 TaxID=3039157 RepID=UPI0024B1A172|nr:WGR domain-containing protein [Rhizobium sp. CB3171]WFU05889.1 WGR domain-containing protein [Rhizobium sp. CB3171]